MSGIKSFEQKQIRSHWDEKEEQWFFSVIDVVEILTKSPRPHKYWSALKTKLITEGRYPSHQLHQLFLS
ncbi:MAG TPA: hypothetical protein DCG69_01660 [Bacteroidales bacterium]|nr:hypothetical protein [Bacteroidales bacterium]